MSYPTYGLTLEQFAEINAQRAKRWHDGDIARWSVSDWLMAMAGEAGEACNAGKKLRRIEESISNLSAEADRQLSTRDQALDKIAEELADTVIYCDLVAARIGRPLADAIRKKFNEVSERYGFPERL